MCASRRVTSWWCGVVRLDDVRGFVFDVDGTLVHRAGEEVHVIPLHVQSVRLEDLSASWGHDIATLVQRRQIGQIFTPVPHVPKIGHHVTIKTLRCAEHATG